VWTVDKYSKITVQHFYVCDLNRIPTGY